MSDNNDELKSKYGKDNKFKYPKRKLVPSEPENAVKDIFSEISDEKQEIKTAPPAEIKKEETKLVKFLKIIISFLIIFVVLSIFLALLMKPKINEEGERLIEQIKKAENLYYTVANKYHYFSRTNYDNTLGIDLNNYKFFSSYEVSQSGESGNYKTKIYGATNTFMIVYFALKGAVKDFLR